MAALNTQQKAPVIITDFIGQPVPASGLVVALDPPTGVVSWGAPDGVLWLTAIAAGACTVTVTKAGSTGTLEVTVTAAPLTLTLGTPEPK